MKKIAVDSTIILGKKEDKKIGYDGNKKILGTKMHVIVASNVLAISITFSRANNYDSTKLIEIMKHILDSMTRDSLKQIKHCFADKGYISKTIREYLENRNIQVHIPLRKNSIARRPKKTIKNQISSFCRRVIFCMVKG